LRDTKIHRAEKRVPGILEMAKEQDA